MKDILKLQDERFKKQDLVIKNRIAQRFLETETVFLDRCQDKAKDIFEKNSEKI